RIAGLSRRFGVDTFATVPSMLTVKSFHSLAEVNVPEGVEEVVCNVQLDPGRTVKGKTVGPDGALLTGCQLSGLADFYTRWEPLKRDTSDSSMSRTSLQGAPSSGPERPARSRSSWSPGVHSPAGL